MAALAGRQHGVVGREQLRQLGLADGAIDHRVAVGRLHTITRGVYAVGHRLIGPRGRWMAAVLSCGHGAVLSHRGAAELWGLLPRSDARVDVTVTGWRRRSRPGTRTHRTRALHPEDRAEREGIPVTSLARTLLDLAEIVSPHSLERAFEEAERLRLLDVRVLTRLLERSPGRHGARALRALVDRQVDVPATRSELERMFVAFCRRAELPQPATNVLVDGFEVDAFWPRERLIVELDGWGFHRTRAAFERDRVRDEALQAARTRVVRITHRRLTEEPAALAQSIRRLLAQGPDYQR